MRWRENWVSDQNFQLCNERFHLFVRQSSSPGMWILLKIKVGVTSLPFLMFAALAFTISSNMLNDSLFLGKCQPRSIRINPCLFVSSIRNSSRRSSSNSSCRSANYEHHSTRRAQIVLMLLLVFCIVTVYLFFFFLVSTLLRHLGGLRAN